MIHKIHTPFNVHSADAVLKAIRRDNEEGAKKQCQKQVRLVDLHILYLIIQTLEDEEKNMIYNKIIVQTNKHIGQQQNNTHTWKKQWSERAIRNHSNVYAKLLWNRSW